MNDITRCIITQYIIKEYQHINKVNHYQVYKSSLQVYINSVSSV